MARPLPHAHRLLLRFPALLLTLHLLLAPLDAAALELRQEVLRGLEDHSARLDAAHSLWVGRDSLRLELRTEWRGGFRDYNRDSRRLFALSQLDGTHRLDGPWRLRWRTRHSLFNERRSLRETLGQVVEGGVRHAGRVDGEVLAGWMQDRRQRGQDQGPRLNMGLGVGGLAGGVHLDGRGEVALEEPGARRNARQEARLNAAWQGPEDTRNNARLLVRKQREDAFPDPLQEKLERRSGLDLELENHYRGRLAPGALVLADVQAWNRRQDRRPRAGEDSTATRGSFVDRGLEFRLEPTLELGSWRLQTAMVFLRQAQEAEYGAIGLISGTRSAIGRQRLQGRVIWLPARDSLTAFAATELRRRDTDFEGASPRDPDDMDQARREGLLRWSRAFAGPSRVALEGGITLAAERHVQASRSRANHLGRTWRAAADHQLGLGAWRLAGRSQVVADYRLYDFDDAEQPRSWIQRRLQVQERARRPILDPGGRWRWTVEARGRWMEEDGGTFLRLDGRERMSDAAREWQVGLGLEARHRPWSLLPGWDWLERRDWDWSAAGGERSRELVRRQRRQGPLLALRRQSATGDLRVDLKWEWMRDENSGLSRTRRNVWARLEWAWRP